MQISEWIEKQKDRLWFAIFLNIIFFAFQLAIFYPAFETNDDMGVMSFVNGVKGTYDEHLVYVNSLWGRLLKSLYTWNVTIQWYTVIQYGLLFISFTAITWVMLRWLKHGSALWLVAVVLVVFTYQGYVRIQYTKSAGIYAAAGLLLLFYAIFQEKLAKAAWAAGMLLALIGSFYRFDQFLCEFALFTALGLYALLSAKRRGASHTLVKCVVTAGILAACAGAGKGADMLDYTQEDWRAYREYDAARSDLLDYGVPDYDTYKETYDRLEIDKAGWQMLRWWTHTDTEKITADTYRQLAALREKKTISRQFFEDLAKTVGPGLLKIHGFWAAVLMALLWILRGRKGLSEWLTVLYLLAVTAFLYVFLFYRGRVLYTRVDTGIWLAAVLIFMWLQKPGRRILPACLCLVILLAAAGGMQYAGHEHWRIVCQQKAEQEHLDRQQVLKEIHEDQEHLYLTKIGTVSYASSYGVWEAVPFGSGDNQYPLGGWTANSPVYMEVLRRYGVGNPFRDMIDNEKVYLIDNAVDLTVSYLQAWYDQKAQARLVREIGDLKVYQIVTK